MVCIVEDDQSVCRALRRLIRSAGLHAVSFETAEDLLMAKDLTEAGCLIVDINLPGMSGLDLQQHLKDTGQHIPTIVITAYANDQVHGQAMTNGAVAFLQKPFHDQALLTALGSVLGH
jgi:FixJ family two-component response regulator